MKIDFAKTIKTLDGKELDPPRTLGQISAEALLGNYPDEKIDGDEKAKRLKLALRIVDAKDVDLKSEEIAKIKRLVGIAYAPLVVGQAFDMLEGEDEATKIKAAA